MTAVTEGCSEERVVSVDGKRLPHYVIIVL